MWSDHDEKAPANADDRRDATGSRGTRSGLAHGLARPGMDIAYGESEMSPGGHLVTTVAACAASVVLTRDLPMADTIALAGGIVTGGFLIDVDHAIDYVLVERQRDLRPGAFLRYYVEGRMRRTVLALHSYELFSILVAAALWLNCLPLTGYVLGALMHLALDVTFNAELTPRSIAAFYSFTYRAAHRFDAFALLGRPALEPSTTFWGSFFGGAQTTGGAPVTTAETTPRG